MLSPSLITGRVCNKVKNRRCSAHDDDDDVASSTNIERRPVCALACWARSNTLHLGFDVRVANPLRLIRDLLQIEKQPACISQTGELPTLAIASLPRLPSIRRPRIVWRAAANVVEYDHSARVTE